jgi:hypothetical protein
VPHYQDACVSHDANLSSHPSPTLALDRVALRFFDEPHGVKHSISFRRFIGTLGHITDQEGIGRSSSHRFRQTYHFLHRHRISGLVPQLYHSSRIPDEDHFRSGLLGHECERQIVGCDPSSRYLLALHFRKL